jgi:hypothetical protein
MDIFKRIKQLVMARKVKFTEKAALEMKIDQLLPEMIFEAIWNAPSIYKTVRSKNPRTGRPETLYIIKGLTLDGMLIYTKGKIAHYESQEVFYVLISSKRSTD